MYHREYLDQEVTRIAKLCVIAVLYERMTNLSLHDLSHVAHLADIPLTDEELEILSPQLSNIIAYFDELSKVKTEGVEPTSQTTGLENVLREDTISSVNTLSLGDALSGSENTHNNFFVVPMVLEGKKDE